MPPCIGKGMSAAPAHSVEKAESSAWEAAATAAVFHESMERFRKGLVPLTLPRSPPGDSPDAKLRAHGPNTDIPRKIRTIIPTRREMELQAEAAAEASVANNGRRARLSMESGVGADAAATALERGAARSAVAAVAAIAATPLSETDYGANILRPRRAPTPRDAVPGSESEEEPGGDLVAPAVRRGTNVEARGAGVGVDADTDACGVLASRLGWRVRMRRVAWLRWRAALSMGSNAARLRRAASARGREEIEEVAQRVAESVVAAVAQPLAQEISAFRAAAETSRIDNEARIAQLAERLESALAELKADRPIQQHAAPRAPPPIRRSSSLPERPHRALHVRPRSDDGGAQDSRRRRDGTGGGGSESGGGAGRTRRLSELGISAGAYASGTTGRVKVQAARKAVLPPEVVRSMGRLMPAIPQHRRSSAFNSR